MYPEFNYSPSTKSYVLLKNHHINTVIIFPFVNEFILLFFLTSNKDLPNKK